MSKYRCLTLEEAVEAIQNDSDVDEADLVILPPDDNGAVTDIEEVEEDDLSQVVPGDVCGQVDVQIDQMDEPNDEVQSVKRKKQLKGRETQIKWSNNLDINSKLPQNIPPKLADLRHDLMDKSPFELFIEIIGIFYKS